MYLVWIKVELPYQERNRDYQAVLEKILNPSFWIRWCRKGELDM